MADVRDAVAGHVAEVLMFLGFAMLFLGGAADVGVVAVLGIVTFFAAVFLSDPIEKLLYSDGEETAADPLDELRERYARGEIDDGEFERRLDRLLETEDADSTGETEIGDPAVETGETDSVSGSDRERATELE